MGDEKKLGVFLESRLGRQGFDDLDKSAKGSEAQAKKSAQAMSSEYEAAFTKIRNAAAVAFAGITAGIGLTVARFGKQEDALNRARSAVEISGSSWDDYGERVAASASKIQEFTRFADEDLTAAFADMTLLSGNAAGAFQNMGLAADVAAGLHMDLGTAARYVGMALSGEVGMLARYVPALRGMEEQLGKNATKAERSAFIIEKLRAQMGGLAEREAKTLTGQLAQMKNAVGDAAENIGSAFAPALVDATNKIKKAAEHVRDWAKENEVLVAVLGKTTLAVTGVVTASALFVTLYPKVVVGIAAIRTALESFQLAILAVRIALLGLPVGWIAAGLTTLGIAIVGIANIWSNLNLDIKEFEQGLDKADTKVAAFNKTLRDAQTEVYAENAALREHIKLTDTLIEEASKENELTEEEIRIGLAAGAAYQAEIDARIAAQKKADEHNRQLIESTRAAAVSSHDFALKEKTLKEMIQSLDPAIRGYAIPALKALQQEMDDVAARAAGKPTKAENTDWLKTQIDTTQAMLDTYYANQDQDQAAETKSFWEGQNLRNQMIGEGVDAWVAAEIMRTSTSNAEAAARFEVWKRERDKFLEVTQSLQDAYRVGVESMIDMDMTGKERREAIWNTFKTSAIRQISEVTAKYLFSEAAKKAASESTLGVQMAASTKSAATDIATAAKAVAHWFTVIAAKIYAFYASLGPFGIPAAAATVAGVMAAIKAIKFQSGGLVPGYGFGDRVPALLESGEFVVRREIALRNLPALQAMNQGRAVAGGGNTYYVTVPSNGTMSFGDELDLKRRIEGWLPDMFESLMERRAIKGLSAE